MIDGNALQAVQSGQTARELVDLVKGGASGFSWIVGAYKTTVTVTVAVSVVTIIMCMFIYGIRADQRLRQDLKYGEGAPLLSLPCRFGQHPS